MSTGKISQLARHRTTIQVNNSVENGFDNQTYDEKQSIDVPTNLNEGTSQSKMLNEMQLHLNQMEQELAIVSEESKDLQQRLIDRQQDLEKKVSKFWFNSSRILRFCCISISIYALLKTICIFRAKKRVTWSVLWSTFVILT